MGYLLITVIVSVIVSAIMSAIVSAVVSLVCCSKAAWYTFDEIDGYVKDIVELSKKSIRDAYLNK